MPIMSQYEYIIDKNHHRAYKEGQVYLHIVVAEQMLNRELLDEEVVHHKDLNKLNNSPDNLIVFSSKSDHSAFHMDGCDLSKLIPNDNGSYSYQRKIWKCDICGQKVSRGNHMCQSCAKLLSRRVERPSKDELFQLLINCCGNFSKLSLSFGVSDNAIRKWCRSYGIPSHSSEYKKLAPLTSQEARH